MFNYRFPDYELKNSLNYRDQERLFQVSSLVGDLYFKHFLKDLKTLIEDFEQFFSLEFRDVYSGDSFVIRNHPRFKNYSLFEVVDTFKTKLDYLASLNKKILDYKNKNYQYVRRFSELDDSVVVPDLYFLRFVTTTSLGSTDVPVVDTSFFTLANSVTDYPPSKKYFDVSDEQVSYIDSTEVWYDRHKYFAEIEDADGETSLNLEYFDGAELFIKGVNISDSSPVYIRPRINGSSTNTPLVLGSSVDFNNAHLIYSTNLETWLLIGTSR